MPLMGLGWRFLKMSYVGAGVVSKELLRKYATHIEEDVMLDDCKAKLHMLNSQFGPMCQ